MARPTAPLLQVTLNKQDSFQTHKRIVYKLFITKSLKITFRAIDRHVKRQKQVDYDKDVDSEEKPE